MKTSRVIVVGLGNPGKEYEKTRHNIGCMVIDKLSESRRVSRDTIIFLVKPQTYMNESGTAVQRALDFHHLDPSHLLVVHDDVDLPLGTIRLHKGRGAAGHKGVESVIRRLKTNEFLRLRCGIGRPEDGNVERFVLEPFLSDERLKVNIMIDQAVQKIRDHYAERNTG